MVISWKLRNITRLVRFKAIYPIFFTNPCSDQELRQVDSNIQDFTLGLAFINVGPRKFARFLRHAERLVLVKNKVDNYLFIELPKKAEY